MLAANAALARRLLPEMQRIVGEHLIGPAPVDEDMHHNTDLIVLGLWPVRVACRVRRFRHYARYGGEVAFRSRVPSGAKTELAKVLAGWGDYLLYGFADLTETRLYAWILGDLKVFRSWFFTALVSYDRGTLPGQEFRPGDGAAGRAFKLADLPAAFVVARSAPMSVLANAPG